MDKTKADALNKIDNLDEPVRLILGYRSKDKVSLNRVPLAQSAQDIFADIASHLVQSFAEREAEDWEPARPVSKETYLVTTPAEVGDVPQVASSRIKPLIHALINSDSIVEVDGSRLRKSDPQFYAYQFGSGEDSTVFLRKMNALRGLRKKRVGILSDQLEAEDKPVFAFDDSADLIFTSEWVFVFSQTAFTYLFRGQSDLEKMIRSWLKGIRESTPMAEGSIEVLLKKSKSDSRIAKRIESISRRGHLDKLSPDTLREGMKQCALDPGELMNSDDELIFSEDNASSMLKFLNEDLFSGVLTNEPFESDSKTPRTR